MNTGILENLKKMVLRSLSIDIIWDKVFENGPSKIL